MGRLNHQSLVRLMATSIGMSCIETVPDATCHPTRPGCRNGIGRGSRRGSFLERPSRFGGCRGAEW